MTINGIIVDVQRGFDVYRGKELLEHFSTYEEANAYAAKARNRYVRYWELKAK